MLNKSILSIAALVLSGVTAQAATTTVLAGDQDCFGLDGVCSAGDRWRDDLGGSFFTDYSEPSDPVGTDRWDAFGAVSFSFDLGAAVSGAVTASLEILYAGLELDTGADVLVNGTSVGSIQTFGPDNFQLVDLGSFSGIAGLLTETTTVTINPSAGTGDGYIIDYASITYDTATVPLPAALPLLLAGLGGLGAMRARRKSA